MNKTISFEIECILGQGYILTYESNDFSCSGEEKHIFMSRQELYDFIEKKFEEENV